MEEEVRLKAYKSKVKVLYLTIDVPNNDDKKDFLYSYEQVLLKLFNNKRENKEILDLHNYYGGNEITIAINLTAYMEDNHDSEKDAIEHLKTWLTSGLDVSNEQVEEYLDEGYIYKVTTYENKIEGISNYIDWED